MNKTKFEYLTKALLIAGPLLLSSSPAFASLESSLGGIKDALVSIILPIFAVIGLGSAALSFFFGNPMAKQHLYYAVFGSVIVFGAQSIVDFISRIVR